MSVELAQVDKTISMPPAVIAAAKRAEELQKQMTAPVEEPVAENPPTDPPAEHPVEVTPASNEPAPVAEKPVEPAPAEDWERRFKSMKGRHDALLQTNQQLREDLDTLREEIRGLKARPQPTQQERKRYLSPEEEEQFGSEFIDVVGKRAREELDPEIETLKTQIETLNQRLAQTTAQTTQSARQQMYSLLDAEVPSWRTMNQDENFIAWLQLPDLYSGDIRQSLLEAAYNKNDSSRVAAFFKGFLAEEAAMSPAAHHPDPAPAQQPAPTKVSLEQFAAPGRAKTAAGPVPPAEKPIFTRAQLAKFYADVRVGAYKGREAEKDKLERQIFEAQHEGRIR